MRSTRVRILTLLTLVIALPVAGTAPAANLPTYTAGETLADGTIHAPHEWSEQWSGPICSKEIISVDVGTAGVGKDTHLTVTTWHNKLLHSFGALSQPTASWSFRPTGGFSVNPGDAGELGAGEPHYVVKLGCVLSVWGAKYMNGDFLGKKFHPAVAS